MSITSEAIWAALPTTNRGRPTVLSADPKGERLAYASNKSIFLRSIDQPEISKQYTQHTQPTTVARFSPSGFYVASGDVTGTVKVWDAVGEGATKGEYSIIAGRINDIAWDGDSQRIIAVGEGKERFGHCITADSGNTCGEVSGHSSQINSVSIRQQRPLRAATGSDDTSMVFYHGAPFKFNTKLQEQHSNYIYGTQFSPDGNALVSVGSDRKVWVYDGKTGEAQKQIGDGEHTGSIFGVSWAKDSKHFATASADQTVKLWDVEAGKATQTWRMGEEGVMNKDHHQVGIVWPHGRTDGLVISVDLEGRLNYFAQGNPKPVKTVYGHPKNITALGLVDESKPTIFTGDYEGRVSSWDLASGTASAVDGKAHSGQVSAFSAGAGRVHSVGWDDTMRTIDVSTNTFTSNPVAALETSGQPTGIAQSHSGHVLIATQKGIDIVSSSSGEKTGELTTKFSLTCIAVQTTDSSTVAVGCDDKSVRLYSISSGGKSLTEAATIPNLTAAPSALAFSPAGGLLAVGNASGGISVYSHPDLALVTSRWSAHTSRVTGISWSKDGLFAVSGSLDTNVFVWSLKSPGKRIKAAGAHKDGVNGVVCIGEEGGKGVKVMSVGADAAVKTWKVTGLA